jgi:hypothetical protein
MAGFNVKDYLMGLFGLGNKPTVKTNLVHTIGQDVPEYDYYGDYYKDAGKTNQAPANTNALRAMMQRQADIKAGKIQPDESDYY